MNPKFGVSSHINPKFDLFMNNLKLGYIILILFSILMPSIQQVKE